MHQMPFEMIAETSNFTYKIQLFQKIFQINVTYAMFYVTKWTS